VISGEPWRAAFVPKPMGYVRCIRAVLRHLRSQRRGRIINVFGTTGRHAAAGCTSGALNAAFLPLTRSIGEVVIADGFRVSAINPGYPIIELIREALATWARDAGQDVESFTSELTGGLLLGGFYELDEVARLLVLLSSDVMTRTLGSALHADAAAQRATSDRHLEGCYDC
jgi:3-oxoacyl-[acyl-carrier protein] reductase